MQNRELYNLALWSYVGVTNYFPSWSCLVLWLGTFTDWNQNRSWCCTVERFLCGRRLGWGKGLLRCLRRGWGCFGCWRRRGRICLLGWWLIKPRKRRRRRRRKLEAQFVRFQKIKCKIVVLKWREGEGNHSCSCWVMATYSKIHIIKSLVLNTAKVAAHWYFFHSREWVLLSPYPASYVFCFSNHLQLNPSYRRLVSSICLTSRWNSIRVELYILWRSVLAEQIVVWDGRVCGSAVLRLQIDRSQRFEPYSALETFR